MIESDPERYSGKWWELAKYPLKWEFGCERSTADYKYYPKTREVYVTNSCWEDGKLIGKRTGVAKIEDKTDPGKLTLRFTDGLPSDSAYAPYWVHWTDYSNYAIVGGPSGKNLWILSREKRVPADDIPMLLEKVKQFGYDPYDLLANPTSVISKT